MGIDMVPPVIVSDEAPSSERAVAQHDGVVNGHSRISAACALDANATQDGAGEPQAG
jgi:hypothetical protein